MKPATDLLRTGAAPIIVPPDRARTMRRAATGLLVYPQAAHLEHFEPRKTRHLMTGTGGYFSRVGRWLKESF